MGGEDTGKMVAGRPAAVAYTADDYDVDAHVPAAAALERLRAGNRIYVEALDHERDLSPERIADLFENGQRPFACVIACADSRVVPEHIFMTGLGELFVIRVAGNIVGPIELASVVYACEHLHTRLVLVLGHTHCGAIKAALDGEAGPVAAITERISEALGEVRDPYEASVVNARASVAALAESPELARLMAEHDLDIRCAVYHTHCGVVDFLEGCD
jgi:carbonic anhydrase